MPFGVARHGLSALLPDGAGVDLELAARRRQDRRRRRRRWRLGRARETLREDAAAIAVLVVALPGDGEVRAVRRRADVRVALSIGRVAVDLELAAAPPAGELEALAEDAVGRAVFVVRGPDDDEIAVRFHRDLGPVLETEGDGVDLELGPAAEAGAGEALTEDPGAVSIQVVVLPHHDEIAVGADANLRLCLILDREAIDRELGADACAANR